MAARADLLASTLLLLAPSAALAAPAGDSTAPSPSASAEVDPTIVGGQEATTCQWPTAVALVSPIGLCTGTLVHPRVVIYAAHCGTDFEQVSFGETMTGTMHVPVDHCERNSTADRVGPPDYAFCVLAQPVDDVPLTPVAYGCEGNMLTVGRQVAIAGFGEDENEEFGVKRWAMTSIVGFDDGMVLIGGGGVGAWEGDSGGPAFVQLDDGGWRTFGIVSGGAGPGQEVAYVPMGDVVPWVEEQADINITPCHAIDGLWQPTPECGSFATEPMATDAWAEQCGANDPRSPLSTTCGAAFVSEENAPDVHIVSPADETVLDQFPAEVTIEIEATDDVSVRAVRLAVDGEVLEERLRDPWRFIGTFPQGTYELVVVAQDWSGNESESDAVTLYVGEEPPGCFGCGAAAGGRTGWAAPLLLVAALVVSRRRRRR